MSNITATSICNEALVFLGEEPLLVFPEATPNSDRCAIFYDRVKETELSKHQWNFALIAEALTQDSTPPPFEYPFQFVLPPDLLRILTVWPRRNRWRRRGQRILAFTSTLNIEYIKNVGEDQFPPIFASVVSARLAIFLAPILTEIPQKFQQAATWYEDALSDAKRIDSHETSVDQMDNLDVVDLRDNTGDSFFFRPINTT